MGKSILIIDYDLKDADSMRRYLASNGYQVVIEARGSHGARTFNEGNFDLVFINLLMPDMPGIEICKRIKVREEGIRTPVYFLSPLASGHNMAARSNGAEGTLSKPPNLGDLLKVAEKHLGPGDPAIAEQESRPSASPAANRSGATPSADASGSKRPPQKSDSNDGAKPDESGTLDRESMPQLLARMGRTKFTGRLELIAQDCQCAIRFREGVIVGLTSGDFLPYLVRTGRMTDADVEQLKELKRRRRADVVDILKSEKLLGNTDVDLLIDRWRMTALKEAALLKSGDFRVYNGDVTGSIHVDPLVLIQHHLRIGLEPPALRLMLARDLQESEPIYGAENPEKRGATGDPDLALILHAADAGATPDQIRALLPDSRSADVGLYELWITGRITQNPAEAWRVPAAPAPTPPPVQPVAAPEPDSKWEEPFDSEIDAFDSAPSDSPESTIEPALLFDNDDDDDLDFNDDFGEPIADDSLAGDRNLQDDDRVLLDDDDDEIEDFAVDPDFEGLTEVYGGRPMPQSSSGQRPSADLSTTPHPNDTGPAIPPGRRGAPLSTREILRRADHLMKEKVYSRAQEYYSEVVLREPLHHEAWTKLARAQFRNRFNDRLDRTIDAVRSCRKAMAIDPEFMPAYQTLLKILEEESKPEIARAVVLQALERRPNDDDMLKRLKNLERRIQRHAT